MMSFFQPALLCLKYTENEIYELSLAREPRTSVSKYPRPTNHSKVNQKIYKLARDLVLLGGENTENRTK